VVTAHAFLSLLAGFAAMAAIVIAGTALLRWLAPEWTGPESTRPDRRPTAGYVFVNLGYTFLAAAAGGYATAWVAGMRPLPSVLALAVAVLALGAISALQARGRQPAWYQLVLLILAPLGVVAGGLVRLRVMGIL
jgi:hypothetical protein